MHYVIYHKQTKKVAEMRHDLSTTPTPLASWLHAFAKCNEVPEADYLCTEITAQKIDFQAGNHIFNEATGLVEADPTYVHPVPVIPAEPTV